MEQVRVVVAQPLFENLVRYLDEEIVVFVKLFELRWLEPSEEILPVDSPFDEFQNLLPCVHVMNPVPAPEQVGEKTTKLII